MPSSYRGDLTNHNYLAWTLPRLWSELELFGRRVDALCGRTGSVPCIRVPLRGRGPCPARGKTGWCHVVGSYGYCMCTALSYAAWPRHAARQNWRHVTGPNHSVLALLILAAVPGCDPTRYLGLTATRAGGVTQQALLLKRMMGRPTLGPSGRFGLWDINVNYLCSQLITVFLL